jgi:predicted amidophosphoribosyltransferase
LSAYEPPLTRLVHEVKFTRWRRLGKDLGSLLGERLKAAITHARAADPKLPVRVVVVPVPSTLRRRLFRGIDHSLILAHAVANTVDGRVVTNLVRRRHRPSQLSVLPSDRVANMAGAFRPSRKKGKNLTGCLVIVVDDVTTTGATLRGACRAVHDAHRMAVGRSGGRVEVWAGVLAVTELEENRRDRGKRGEMDEPGAECVDVEKKSALKDSARLD